jgi:FlaA1/EpsC-like NDP-sugar epimerase/lipopolysaccharide/colanic/teichoic acid biosynthesis glycosyltransferase
VSLKPRLLLINLVDAVLLNVSVLAALALRFDGRIPQHYLHSFAASAFFYTAAMLLLINMAGINRALWRYAGVPTLLILVRTLFLGFGAAFLLNTLPQVRLFPMTVIILTWVVATGLILASRLTWKMLRTPARSGVPRSVQRTLIVGAGDVGAIIARELERGNHGLGLPIGFVDDDPRKVGRSVEQRPVLGTTFEIPRLIVEHRVTEVLIAAPSAPARLVRQVVEFCQDAGIECKTVPSLTDYVVGKGALGQVRDVQIEDLLGREPVSIDVEGIGEQVRGRTVLVTGAGGSIGSELCRQLARFEPGALIALDHCENRLCYLGLDLGEQVPALPLTLVVGDIRDDKGIPALFRQHRPDLVFHAAAHKHVNLLETAPREAILNNILGTRNLARAASAEGVKTFVFISTDKAVNPTNVMGASKRACEILLQGMSLNSRTTFVAVRFGNVLGSDGSVIPIFRRQLAKGGPLTVTHPEVRRFFMTIPEASQLVIQAALFGKRGDVFVLDMGEQVRILDVAEQLIRLSGLRPGVDIPIRYIGLRPGEKLEEELLTDQERTRLTEHKKIFRLELDPVEPGQVEELLEEMAERVHQAEPDELRVLLARFVPEYQRKAVAPLPGPEKARSRSKPAEGTAPVVLPPEPRSKRALDLVLAGLLLTVLLPVTGLLLLLYRLSGQGEVRFVRQELVGLNRRKGDRRRMDATLPIDRRDRDRRQRPLPGRPFVAYRLEFKRAGNAGQRAMARLLQRYRLDRVLHLWCVLRGDMSLVGPTSRLVDEVSFTQSRAAALVFARRPGLTGPGAIFASFVGDDDARRALYDGFYARHGGARLDVDSLLRACARLFRGEDPLPPAEESSSGEHGVEAARGQEVYR